MSLSVSGFINRIRDMINYRTLSQQEIEASAALTQIYEEGWTTIRQRNNIDQATLRGVSTNVKFLLPYGFTIGGGYTLTRSYARSNTLNQSTQHVVFSESPVDKSVRDVGSVNASWDRGWGNYHLNVCLNGHMQGRRYSSTYGFADGYSQWDLSTRHTFYLKQIDLEPGLGVENIFNKRDTSYWNSNFSTINPGRSLYVSLTLKFHD